MDIIFFVVVILLIVLGTVSFAMFIRRMLINFQVMNNTSIELNKKLDKVIELLENNSKI